MKNVPKEYAKAFFLEAKILSENEINLMLDYCTFGITMPTASNNKVVIQINTNKVLPTNIYSKLINFPDGKIMFDIKSNNVDIDFSRFDEYIQTWIKNNHADSYMLQDLFTAPNYSISDGVVSVKYVSNTELQQLNKIEDELRSYLKNANLPIKEFVYTLNKEKQNQILDDENKRKEEIENMIKATQKDIGEVKRWDNYFRVSGSFTDLNEVNDEFIGSSINVAGEIISVEKKESKKNAALIRYEFVIYDGVGNGALKCSYSAFKTALTYKKPKTIILPIGYLDSFKKGEWINIHCLIESNKYTGFEPCGRIIKMCHTDRPDFLQAKDEAQNKRVELLMHSNMTAYEGINSAKTIYEHATACGYSSIGIIERNNVQSIPDIFNANKEFKNIKPIYGCEFEVIEHNIPIVVNPIDQPIGTADYIVFDIETTGLYPEFDDLIEFGAIKFKDDQIIDRVDFFVKPTKPLTNVAINLSHITNEMVEGAISQKQALIKIKEWIGKDVLVAHNGIRFDLNFLNKLCERFNVEPINNCLIDTLEISHAINKKLSKHTLGTLVGKLRVEYNPLEAHRADKDSEYLLEVWKYFIRRLSQEGIHNIKDINDKLQTAALRASRRGSFVDVYVKNQAGLRNLFDLLSLALTKQLYQKDDDDPETVLSNGQPKLHFSDFDQYRDNLIICPHPFDGDIWESALNDRQEKLEEKIKKYDYIFVAPNKNVEYLVHQDKITKNDINKALKKIIETSNRLIKPICAVSDAYYCLPSEQKIHEIYVYTKQLGGKRNPLYRHDGTTFVPDLHLMTTNQMLEAFKFIKDEKLLNDIVITNTQKFADSIEKVVSINDSEDALCKPEMPEAKPKLEELVWSTAKKLYGENIDQAIVDRINKEMNGILSKGYEVIYWISHLLIEQSNRDGYMVGSRGSVGSSVIAFLSNISEVNPLPPYYLCSKCKHFEWYPDKNVDGFDLPAKKCPKCGADLIADGHNIPFESFLGFKADKLPDIDLNFSGEYQAKAHEFIRDMFGEGHAFRAGTIGTVAEKTAIGFVKSYYEQTNPEFKPMQALLKALASKCEGVKRTTGQHPGGIVVVPEGHNITEFTPFNYPSNDKTKGWLTTHFDFHSIDKNLLKFDILGHDEPTILKHLHDITHINPQTIPNHDEKVLQLFANSKSIGIVDEKYDQEQLATMALPEFGTTMTRRIVLKTKPTCVGDLIRISGLSHGTGVWQGNAEDLVANGAQLSQVAACRENIFQYLIDCGMDYVHAFQAVEKIRKGKGVSTQYEKEMIDSHVPEWYISSCKKIKYLFPKAHATAYVLDALRTAWYKVYYPAQFYAVWFSIRSDVFDIETVLKGPQEIEKIFKDYKARENSKDPALKLTNKQIDLIPIFEVCLEMFARGIKILNIDLNKSSATEFIAEGNTILAPFTSLDGLGKEAADSIIAARNEKPFSSIADLQKRTKLSSTLTGKLETLGVLENLDQDDQMRLF